MATWWSGRFTARLGVPLAVEHDEVSGLTVAAGSVTAQVHGSRREAYDVWIDLPVFTPAEWARAEQALAADADCHDRILDGDLPPALEGLFAGCGLSLLPAVGDLAMDCSCPEWAMPCVHVTAVLRVLAETFGSDPFGILTWRGRTRVRLLRHLHALRTSPPEERRAHPPDGSRSVSGSSPAGPSPTGPPPAGSSPVGSGPEPAPAGSRPEPVPAGAERPLADCLDDYWREGAVHADGPDPAETDSGPALDRLGSAGLAIRGRDLAALLRPAYEAFRAR